MRDASVAVEPLAPDQFDLAAAWLGDPERNRWLNSAFRHRDVTPRLLAVMLRDPRNRLLLVRMDGEPVGLVGFAELDLADRVGMIWYLIGSSSHEGRNITTRAVRQALTVAFEQVGLENVYAWVREDNLGSARVLEKAGFSQVGRLRRAVQGESGALDRIYFDLTREDHERQRTR